MKVFGLTGGIGMGKSAAGILLRNCGVPVIDTDEIARQVVAPGSPSLEEIRAAFGPQVISTDGSLSRKKLAEIVFSNPEARRNLERITHPRIRDRWKSQVNDWRASGEAVAVVVIPLLFETGAESDMASTICVACTASTQLERLHVRHWTSMHIQQRITAQWPVERKIARADYVAWSEGGLDLLAEQLNRILKTR